MKILGPGETGKADFAAKPKKEEIKGNQSFDKILSEESGKVKGTKTEQVSSSKNITGPQFPSHITFSSFEAGLEAGKEVDQMKIMALTEQVLTRLDFLKSALENPQINISKFSPLIDALNVDSKNLKEISSKLISDPRLKNLLDETSTLTTMEVLKFYRKDYG